MGFIVAIVYLVVCILVASGAKDRNRSGFGYFILSLLISPLLTGLLLCFLGEKKR